MASIISETARPDELQESDPALSRQFSDVAAELRQLAAAVVSRDAIRRPFEQAEASLAALPLSQHDCAVASCRVRHAKRLVWHGELKAAGEELKLVAECIFTGG